MENGIFFDGGGVVLGCPSPIFWAFCGGGVWWWCCFVVGGGGAAVRPSFAVYVAYVVYLLLRSAATHETELYL